MKKKKKKQNPRGRAGKRAVPSKKDLKLLEEIGFRRTQTLKRRRYLLDNKLRMRQLDQLKMMFFRMGFMEGELFPHDVKMGILKNDMSAYSEAIHTLFVRSEEGKRRKNPKKI